MFKSGDLIIYMNNSNSFYQREGIDPVIHGNIYKVSHYNSYDNVCFAEFAGFNGSSNHGYYPHSCEKITNLTEELKFKIIKQKLGVQGGKV